MTILVTGGTGFLGQAVVRGLIAAGEHVQVLVRPTSHRRHVNLSGAELIPGNLVDAASLNRALQGTDAVIHCGAYMDTTGGWEAFEAVTVRGTEHLLEAAQRHQVKRFVHVSSLSVYEQIDQATLTEDALFAQHAEGLGHYSRSKIEAERLVWHYAQEYGLPITVLRPGKLYGLGQPPVIAPLRVPVGGKFQIVIASSKQRLPLTYVENAAEAICLAMHCEQAVGRAYNIVDQETIQQGTYLALLREVGLSQARTLLLPPAPFYPLVSLVAQMCRLIGISPPLSRRQLERALASIRYDTTRAQAELGWRPKVDLVEALQTMREAQGETTSA